MRLTCNAVSSISNELLQNTGEEGGRLCDVEPEPSRKPLLCERSDGSDEDL
jgi:hypothetical protein